MNANEKSPEIEFERHIQDAMAGKKEEIEKRLAEVIEQEKEKARHKISEMEQEFQKGKEALRRHKEMLDEVAAAAAEVREKIRQHVEQARHCRTMIQRMADQIREECRQARDLRQEVIGLHGRAEEETRRLQKEMESRFGAAIPFPDVPGPLEVEDVLDRELEELSDFIKSMGPRPAEVPAIEPIPEMSCGLEEPAAERPAPAEAEAPAPAPAEAPAGEPEGQESSPETQAQAAAETEEEQIARKLEALKMTESFPGGGELRFFQNDSMIVLDGESLLDQMIRFIEDARVLHTHLEETKSAKEQFFIKRDILNLQEFLRKVIIRAIKLCEKGTCDLPVLTSDVMSMQTLRDILERLSMGNWSDPYDMKSFGEEVFRLRATMFARTTDQVPYRKSILEQLDQR